MKLTKSATKFELEIVQPIIEKYLLLLDSEFRSEKQQLVLYTQDFLYEVFGKIAANQNQQNINEISYIHFSGLRGPLLYENKLLMDVSCYGKKWFSDSSRMNLQKSYIPLINICLEAKSEIEEAFAKKRRFELKGYENFFIAKYFEFFIAYIYALFQYSLQKDGDKLLKELRVSTNLYILSGEYKGVNNLIYVKEQAKAKEGLLIQELDKIFNETNNLSHLIFHGKNLRDDVIINNDCRNSEFKECTFINCIIQNVNFENAILKDCNFSNSVMVDTSFKDSDCSDCNFSNIIANPSPSFRSIPNYFGIDFENANLDQSTFIGAQLGEINFKNASMKGTKILISHKDKLLLNSWQREEIEWVIN